MCTLFDEIATESERVGRSKGREEGREEGRAAEIVETGYEFGLSDGAIVERLQNKLSVSRQVALEYLRRYGKQG